jgi:hypothetical protein
MDDIIIAKKVDRWFKGGTVLYGSESRDGAVPES